MKYLYMRASTNETKQSLQRQEKFGRDNNIPEANWFKEFASGANNDRVELNRLLSMVKENDEIYAIDPSRITRSLKFMMELLDFAKEKKIKERQSLNRTLSMLYMQYKNESISHDQYLTDKTNIENLI